VDGKKGLLMTEKGKSSLPSPLTFIRLSDAALELYNTLPSSLASRLADINLNDSLTLS
jgi:hypothetical protein